MRIAEFQITQYGPLKPTDKIRPKDFDLFYGKNEHGKTLLIDSLVKILLGGNTQSFQAIDRVDEFPEGYGLVKDKDDKVWKLPEKGDLTRLSELTPTELRNVFIIRNSDLTIPAEDEFEFYRNITERLTGLKTPMIRSVKESLQQIGNLTKATSLGTLTDSAASGKLKSRVRHAGSLIEQIKGLVEKAETENTDMLEEQFSNIAKAESVVVQEIENVEAAQKREKYEEGKRALEALTQTGEQLEQMEVFNDDDLQSWRECERDLKRCGKAQKDLSKKLAETKKELERKESTLDEKSRELERLDGRKKIIDEEIRPRLTNFEVKSKGLASQQSREKFAAASFSAFLILLAISLIGFMVSQLSLFVFSSTLFLVLALLFAALKLLLLQKKGSVAAMWQEVRLNASKLELDAENVKEVLAQIQTFDEAHSENQRRVRQLQTEAGVLRSKLSSLTDEELPAVEKETKEIEDKINGLQIKSKVESLQDYSKNLRTKQAQEKMWDGLVGILKSHFGERSRKASIEDNIEYWKEMVAELEPYKEKAKEIKYSEKRVSELKEKARETKEQKAEIEEKLADFRDELDEISRQVNDSVKPLESPPLCETLVDLREISNVLQEFVVGIEANTSTVLDVMKIFEAIEGEEEQKVEQLFGENSPVSSYFREITEGLYQKVEYLSDVQKIQATMKTGEILDAHKLSGGAYDQLYLCIRLALGEKLLKGEKGFFIMDDPFIKADTDRLAKQLDVLKRISKDGWQILYFTAKEEVQDALKQDVASKSIGYHEIQKVFS